MTEQRVPIVEVADSPDGLIEIKARDANGDRIGFFQISASAYDDQLVAAITEWQARHAGVRHGLHVV